MPSAKAGRTRFTSGRVTRWIERGWRHKVGIWQGRAVAVDEAYYKVRYHYRVLGLDHEKRF